jgi:hypothetical protein
MWLNLHRQRRDLNSTNGPPSFEFITSHSHDLMTLPKAKVVSCVSRNSSSAFLIRLARFQHYISSPALPELLYFRQLNHNHLNPYIFLVEVPRSLRYRRLIRTLKQGHVSPVEPIISEAWEARRLLLYSVQYTMISLYIILLYRPPDRCCDSWLLDLPKSNRNCCSTPQWRGRR